jgi:hypothetical protein
MTSAASELNTVLRVTPVFASLSPADRASSADASVIVGSTCTIIGDAWASRPRTTRGFSHP